MRSDRAAPLDDVERTSIEATNGPVGEIAECVPVRRLPVRTVLIGIHHSDTGSDCVMIAVTIVSPREQNSVPANLAGREQQPFQRSVIPSRSEHFDCRKAPSSVSSEKSHTAQRSPCDRELKVAKFDHGTPGTNPTITTPRQDAAANGDSIRERTLRAPCSASA